MQKIGEAIVEKCIVGQELKALRALGPDFPSFLATLDGVLQTLKPDHQPELHTTVSEILLH